MIFLFIDHINASNHSTTLLEACTSLHEDSITCPLEVSELEPHENNLSDVDNKVLVSIIWLVLLELFLL